MPLKSTRADVERLLGSPTQTTSFGSYYRLQDSLAMIWFQHEPCGECARGGGWHVPTNTVISVGVIPLAAREPKLSELTGFKVEDADAGFVYYTNEADGLTIETLAGKITNLSYEPEQSSRGLRCLLKDCIPHFRHKFDAYAILPWNDEKARLENYAIHLKENMMRGAIVVYGPNEAQRASLIKRATRSRKHLKTFGLEPQRILILNGGYREDSGFELHRYGIGTFVSRIYLWPEKDPTKAKSETKK